MKFGYGKVGASLSRHLHAVPNFKRISGFWGELGLPLARSDKEEEEEEEPLAGVGEELLPGDGFVRLPDSPILALFP